MEKEEIELVVSDAILNFPKSIQKPIVLFLEKKRFSKYLDLMSLRKHVSKTPCFVAEMKGGNVVFFSLDVVNGLIKGFSKEKKKLFIEAVILHELFHIWNKLELKNSDDAIFSEVLVHQEMKEMYPKQYDLLKRFRR